jgi:hypothetical protein
VHGLLGEELTAPQAGSEAPETVLGGMNHPTRKEALRSLIVLPALAGAIGLATPAAQAADNKKQFKYQDKPGKNGEKCSECKFFKAPHACSIVTGTISPNGWCIAWAKK